MLSAKCVCQPSAITCRYCARRSSAGRSRDEQQARSALAAGHRRLTSRGAEVLGRCRVLRMQPSESAQKIGPGVAVAYREPSEVVENFRVNRGAHRVAYPAPRLLLVALRDERDRMFLLVVSMRPGGGAHFGSPEQVIGVAGTVLRTVSRDDGGRIRGLDMSQVDAVSRVAQIHAQLAALQTASRHRRRA